MTQTVSRFGGLLDTCTSLVKLDVLSAHSYASNKDLSAPFVMFKSLISVQRY